MAVRKMLYETGNWKDEKGKCQILQVVSSPGVSGIAVISCFGFMVMIGCVCRIRYCIDFKEPAEMRTHAEDFINKKIAKKQVQKYFHRKYVTYAAQRIYKNQTW